MAPGCGCGFPFCIRHFLRLLGIYDRRVWWFVGRNMCGCGCGGGVAISVASEADPEIKKLPFGCDLRSSFRLCSRGTFLQVRMRDAPELPQQPPRRNQLLNSGRLRKLPAIVAALLVCTLIDAFDTRVTEHRELASEFRQFFFAHDGLGFGSACHLPGRQHLRLFFATGFLPLRLVRRLHSRLARSQLFRCPVRIGSVLRKNITPLVKDSTQRRKSCMILAASPLSGSTLPCTVRVI